MAPSRQDKKKAAPPSKTETGAKPDQPRAPVGKTSGVGVSETWVQIFEQNAQRDEEARLTDEQISESMKSEFPDLDSIAFGRVAVARGKYNRGGFHKKDKAGKVVRPKIQSKAHDFAGDSHPAAKNRSRSDTAPVQSRVVTHQKDFKSHKK